LSLHHEAWALHLSKYPDDNFVKSILHIIDHGALSGFVPERHSQDCENLKSAIDYPEFVTNAVHSAVLKGQAHGPFNSPPLGDFVCSPLGTVTRPRNPLK